jgi:hypothetical protein
LISSIDQDWLPIQDEKTSNLTWKIQHKELFCLLLINPNIVQRTETTGAFHAALMESHFFAKLN